MPRQRKRRKKIILASASPQRHKLLKLIGIPFTTRPSKVKELSTKTSHCASLVKKNALLKARDVADRVDSGIVIGADSLVYLGKRRIIGKPKNLKEAKKTLWMLSRHPQWIYTGLAIIDVESKKTIVDYEKTKVFMRKLSREEIDRYYRLISPLDKAGGFDIEGKGSLFIKKVHGCYFNVVGLPVAKLCEMLKKVGVSILSLAFIVQIWGCTTEYNLATQQQETYLYNTDKEIKIGENIAKQFAKEFEMSADTELNAKVARIGRRLTDICDRKELVYIFRVINEDKVNAVSLPGGFIYVFQGLIDHVETDDELASVMAHEIGHITARHAIKKLQSLYGYTFLKLLTIQTQSAALSQGLDAAFATAFTEYSLEDEFLADKLAVKYLQEAGYDPRAVVTFLAKLREIQQKEPSRPLSYWRTHPYITQRISAANQVLTGRLEFKDYINLMGEQ
ncbi:MAG: Maf family nucleotide pyrophosphatase [Candidatus Omnitrophota bacterium]